MNGWDTDLHAVTVVFTPLPTHSHPRREGLRLGETFSGVDWATGLVAAGQFTALVAEQGPAGATAAQVAIAWCAQQSGVTTVIPGARTPDQARANAAAAALLPLPAAVLDGVVRIYDEHLRAAIHPRW